MAQSGYTPISLYYTTTAAAVPTSGNLVNGELAINITDGKLYYKNNSGVVTLLAGATAGPAGGSNTQVQYNSSGALAGSANLTFNGTTLTANTIGAFTLGGTVAGGGNQLNNVIIGTTTPLAGAFTTLSSTGITSITDVTEATSTTAASLKTAGGLGVAKKAFLGGAVNITDTTASTSKSTGALIIGGNIGLNGTNTGRSYFGGPINISTDTYDVLNTSTNSANGTALVLANTYTNGKAWEWNSNGRVGNGEIVLRSNTDSINVLTVLSTGLAVTGTLSSTLDATIYGLTVGRGGGAVSTNTAVGASALASNSTGAEVTAIGYQALFSNTGSQSTAVGVQALRANTSGSNAAFGQFTLYANTTGTANAGFGGYGGSGNQTLVANTTGSNNSAFGMGALASNTTASNNTAVGYQAGYTNTTGAQNTDVGMKAGYLGTTRTYTTSMGYFAGYSSNGVSNTYIGYASGPNNGTASVENYNTGIGAQALNGTTTGSYNTAVGFQAGYSNTTSSDNTFIGYVAGYTFNTTGQGFNAAIGRYAGYGLTTGTRNTFVGGTGSGYLITTGASNTILGCYTGNQSGLDIRTSSNYVVLSDGSGNIVFYTAGSSGTPYSWGLPGSASIYQGAGITFPATQSASTDANTLDDYEEGTWTPTDNSGAGLSFTGVSATYTKVGRLVNCLCELNYPVTASVASANIAGLPFTSANTQANRSGGVVTISTTSSVQRIYPANNSTAFPLLNATGSAVTNATCSGAQFNFCITFYT
jgi:hypothetical protein